MTDDACRAPISLAELSEYWLGELPGPRKSEVEQHLFACSTCSRALEELAALAGGLKALARKAAVATVVTPAFVERLKDGGVRIREYHLAPGGSVNCTLLPEEDLAVAHVQADLGGVKRLDVVFEDVAGGLDYRFTDVAFNPDAGEIVLAPRAADLRGLQSVDQRVTLVAVTDSSEKVLGEYLFRHTPYGLP